MCLTLRFNFKIKHFFLKNARAITGTPLLLNELIGGLLTFL